MAVETRCGGSKIKWDMLIVSVSRRHVPHLTVGIPVHWRFEEIAIYGKKIGSSASSLSNVIEQFPFAIHVRIAGSIKTQPDFTAFTIDRVAYSGRSVNELA